MNYVLNAYAFQDIGQRKNQEDCFYPPFIDPCHYNEISRDWSYYDGTAHTDDRLFIVCDGMGGHDRGEVASHIVTHTMSKKLLQSVSLEGAFNDEMLKSAVDKALHSLIALDDPNVKKKMGTTMTALKFHANGATIGHIGDSRVYQFRPAQNGKPAQILFRTEDHTIVNDMLHNGQLTVEQARSSSQKHILSRSMTSSPEYHPEVEINHITDIKPNDIFFLCTDGVFENLTDTELCSILTDPNYSDVEIVQKILHVCQNNRDNHTGIMIRVADVINTTNDSKHSSTLAPGTVLKSENYTYHIEKVLGQGAFGITYLVNTNIAMQGQLGTIHTGVKVALKEFFMQNDMKREGGELIENTDNSKVTQYAKKFRREANKLAMLSHPNIVRVLEVFEANNTIYYSMEYLPDGSLNDYVNKKGGLPEIEAIGCIRRIGSALLYLHANKMLHLDVKPANIMRVESTNTLKLIDFGLSKRYEANGDPESSANLGAGTSGYAPLEQGDANNEMEFSPQLDVYALGATYYKLLTGLVPDKAIDVLNRGVTTLPLVKKKVSQQSINAIRAAMEPTIAKRLKTVDAFLDMLPRVDDESIFPQYKKRAVLPWAIVAGLVAMCTIIYGVMKLRQGEAHNNNRNIASVVDSHFNIPMVSVAGGTFMMGSDAADADNDEHPVHEVSVSTFQIGKYEITENQWHAVMDNIKQGKSKNGNLPMVGVTWNEVQDFIRKLNQKTGRHYRLPTEAEWEYAARGGQFASEYPYSGSENIDSVAWTINNSSERIHPVGLLKPNKLGIYDMSGNAWEYCEDWYDDYVNGDANNDADGNTDAQANKNDTKDKQKDKKTKLNPEDPKQGMYHVIRGGSWDSKPYSCRVTYRQDESLRHKEPSIGLRLVLDTW